MSTFPSTWVWKHSPTRGNERLALLLYADFANDAGLNSYPGAQLVADLCRFDLGTARRTTARLIEGGHLEVMEQGGGRGRKAMYRVVMDLDEIRRLAGDDDLDGDDDEDGDGDATVSVDDPATAPGQGPASGLQEPPAAPPEAVDDEDVIDSSAVEADANLGDISGKGGAGATVSFDETRAPDAPVSRAFSELQTRAKPARNARESGSQLGKPDPYKTPPTERADSDKRAVDGSPPRGAPTGEEDSQPPVVDEALAAMALAELEADEIRNPGSIGSPAAVLRHKRHRLGLDHGPALRALADEHPNATPAELVDLHAGVRLRTQMREPIEQRARAFAAWCDPTSSSFATWTNGLTDTEIDEALVDEIARVFFTDGVVDDELLELARTTYRAERARLTDQQETR